MLYERAFKHASEKPQDSDCLADIRFRVGKCLLKCIGTGVDIEKAHELLSLALIGFYKRRKTDPFVGGLIKSAKKLIGEAEKIFDSGIYKS